MNYLYKIHSGYDGFRPARIPQRLVEGRYLELGWAMYLEEVDEGDEVWVYFRGPHRFEPGVYLRGMVESIDLEDRTVQLRVQEYSVTQPLTDQATSERVGRAVSTWFRQVFLFPDEWATAEECTIAVDATSCAQRRCEMCPTWCSLPRIEPAAVYRPRRLEAEIEAYVPAYWVVPPRAYVYYQPRPLLDGVAHTTQVFRRFKTGEEELAYPLALGIFDRLQQLRMLRFDCVVPIPLSPDKAARRELHRTRALAQELGRRLVTPVVELLTLTEPISKHRLRTQGGLRPVDFERAYSRALVCDARASLYTDILVVDDACTEGSTLQCATEALHAVNPGARIYLAAAGQMVVRDAVADDNAILV